MTTGKRREKPTERTTANYSSRTIQSQKRTIIKNQFSFCFPPNVQHWFACRFLILRYKQMRRPLDAGVREKRTERTNSPNGIVVEWRKSLRMRMGTRRTAISDCDWISNWIGIWTDACDTTEQSINVSTSFHFYFQLFLHRADVGHHTMPPPCDMTIYLTVRSVAYQQRRSLSLPLSALCHE